MRLANREYQHEFINCGWIELSRSIIHRARTLENYPLMSVFTDGC